MSQTWRNNLEQLKKMTPKRVSKPNHRIDSALPSIEPAQPVSIPTHLNMKPAPQPVTITIPAVIVDLPDLTLPERVILSVLLDDPCAGNGKLARRAWLTRRGVEALTRRLRKQGHLQLFRLDGARRLVVTAAAHTKCAEVRETKPHTSCGDPSARSALLARPKFSPATEAWLRSLPRFLEIHERAVEHHVRHRQWQVVRMGLELCINRVTNEPGLDPEVRNSTLARLQRRLDLNFGLEHILPLLGDVSEPVFRLLRAKLDTVSDSRLAELRRGIESGASLLGPAREILALPAPVETVPTQPTPPASSLPVAPASLEFDDPDEFDDET